MNCIRCRPWFVLVMAFVSVSTTAISLSGADAKMPNIVIVLADDLGYGDPGCYGGKIATPNIDRLAVQGMRFTDAHTTSAVCSPTRYGLMTGRYNWRSKLQSGVLGGLSPRLIEPGRMTIASMLKERGYHTACIGKWHLGMDWTLKPGGTVTELNIEPRDQVFNVDYAQAIKNGPNSVGFDRYFGISASLDMVPYTFIEDDHVSVLPTEDRDFLMMHERTPNTRTRKGPTAPGFEAEDVLPTLTRQSVEYIESRAVTARADQPFFLYVPLASPHTPILPKNEWQGKSGLNPYADFVMQTDAAIGEILAVLDKQQLTDQTLFVLTSDNGCSPQAKFEELTAKGHHPSGPLRGHKADLFEGGHRVPFIVRWPGRVAAGTTNDRLVCQTDLFATIASIVGADIPENAAEDSFLLPMFGDGSYVVRSHVVSHSINGSFAIRRNDWKLLLCPDSGGWSAPRPGSPGAKGLPSMQLYNLHDDLKEMTNLIDHNSEQAQELLTMLEDIVQKGRSTSGSSQRNQVPVDFRARIGK